MSMPAMTGKIAAGPAGEPAELSYKYDGVPPGSVLERLIRVGLS